MADPGRRLRGEVGGRRPRWRGLGLLEEDWCGFCSRLRCFPVASPLSPLPLPPPLWWVLLPLLLLLAVLLLLLVVRRWRVAVMVLEVTAIAEEEVPVAEASTSFSCFSRSFLRSRGGRSFSASRQRRISRMVATGDSNPSTCF